MEGWLLMALSTWRARGGLIVIHVVLILVAVHVVKMVRITRVRELMRAAFDVPSGDCQERKQAAVGAISAGDGRTGYRDACGEGTERK